MIGGWCDGSGPFVRPYRGLFFTSLCLMPLNSCFSLAQPYMIKLTVDLFLSPRAGHQPPRWLAPALNAAGGHGLAMMGAIYAVLLLGEFSCFFGQFYLTMIVAQYSLSDLRLALFRHVEQLPMAFFDRNPVGRLVSRMTTDIDAINEMFGSGSLTLLMDLLTLSGIIVIMLSLSFIWVCGRCAPCRRCWLLFASSRSDRGWCMARSAIVWRR